MLEKLAELQLFADAFEIALDMQSFSSRLLVQKKIYLLQLFGVDLGFRYGWYIRGPYCPALTKRVYELEEQSGYGDQIKRNYELKNDAKQKVNDFVVKYNQMLCGLSGANEADKAELLVSLHYIRNREMRTRTQDEVINELLARKNWYDRDQILVAWKMLFEQGLMS